MENDPLRYDLPQEAWQFETDASLIERAERDDRLANMLQGLARARMLARSQPDNPTFTELFSAAERATGEYVIGTLGWRPPDPAEQGRPSGE